MGSPIRLHNLLNFHLFYQYLVKIQEEYGIYRAVKWAIYTFTNELTGTVLPAASFFSRDFLSLAYLRQL